MIINFCTNLTAAPNLGLIETAAGTVVSLWELQTSPTDDFLLLGVTANAFNSGTGMVGYCLALGRPAAQGVGQVVYQPPVAENDPLNAQLPAVTLYTAWSIRPTAPAAYLRRATFNTSMGNGISGTGRHQHFNLLFPNGIRVPPSSSLALYGVGPQTTLSPVALDFSLIGED